MCSTPPSGVIFEFATSLGAAGFPQIFLEKIKFLS